MSVQPKLNIQNKNIDTILVLDFGSQYTQLIARRIRESDVYSEILPWDVDIKKIKDINPKGIILSGGPESVTDLHTPSCLLYTSPSPRDRQKSRMPSSA